MGGILCSGVDDVRTMTARILCAAASPNIGQINTRRGARLLRWRVYSFPVLRSAPSAIGKRVSATTGGLTRRAAGRQERGARTVGSTSKACSSWGILWLQELKISPHGYISQYEPLHLPVLYLSWLVSRVPT